ncbi:MAG: hypothetical protein AB4352_25115 [Hormoscilla sp.]
MGSSHRKDMEDRLLDLGRDMAPLIEALHKADRRLHNIMSIEFSSLASTMDELDPGFWSKYMAHRQEIFQKYMQERQQRQQNQANSKSSRETAPRRQSPFQSVAFEQEAGSEEASAASQETEDRISLFSEFLDRELPPLKRYYRS